MAVRERRIGWWRVTAGVAGGALLAAALWAASADGRVIYRWTDERGVIHFADVPPPQVTAYSGWRVPATAPPAAAPPEELGAPAAAPAPVAAPAGPARVVIADRRIEPISGALQMISGTVENAGGTPATDVVVSLEVSEPIQGEVCLQDVIEVEPSALAPGEKGRFEVEVDNPCFLGPTEVELRVEWE